MADPRQGGGNDDGSSAAQHAQVWASIPWCVAGSARPEELAQARAHIESCPDCRAEWALNQRWREALGDTASGPGATAAGSRRDEENAAAAASLDVLWRRIDADAAMSVLPPATTRRGRWVVVLAAASVLQAVGLVALAALWWQGAREARYETLSRETPLAPQIQLQLAPSANEADVQQLVERLRQEPLVSAVAGPSPSPGPASARGSARQP